MLNQRMVAQCQLTSLPCSLAWTVSPFAYKILGKLCVGFHFNSLFNRNSKCPKKKKPSPNLFYPPPPSISFLPSPCFHPLAPIPLAIPDIFITLELVGSSISGFYERPRKIQSGCLFFLLGIKMCLGKKRMEKWHYDDLREKYPKNDGNVDSMKGFALETRLGEEGEFSLVSLVWVK